MSREVKFYHGGASRPVLQNIREACPSLVHGNGWAPGKKGLVLDRDHPYFLDNGAFTSSFNEEEWIEMLDKVENFDSEPDFVVLPDVFNNPKKTFERAKKYYREVQKRGFDYFYVAQKPEEPFQAVHKAIELDADGVFIGGDWDWKLANSQSIVELGHKYNLRVHIGMPKNYYWAYQTGADSMDSVTCARHEDYNRMRRLEDKISGVQRKVMDY